MLLVANTTMCLTLTSFVPAYPQSSAEDTLLPHSVLHHEGGMCLFGRHIVAMTVVIRVRQRVPVLILLDSADSLAPSALD